MVSPSSERMLRIYVCHQTIILLVTQETFLMVRQAFIRLAATNLGICVRATAAGALFWSLFNITGLFSLPALTIFVRYDDREDNGGIARPRVH